MNHPPTIIEGKQVDLCRFSESHADDLYRHIRSKAVARWGFVKTTQPSNRAAALQWIRRMQRRWRAGKQYNYGIILKESEQLVGGVDFYSVDWHNKKAGLGYWLHEKYWNNGFMTEAVRLMLPIGFKHLRFRRIHARVFEPNVGSCRVLEKCGFHKEGVLREAFYLHKQWQNVYWYSMLRSEYQRSD